MEINSNNIPKANSNTPIYLLITWVFISIICLCLSIVSITFSFIQKKEIDKIKTFIGYNDPNDPNVKPSPSSSSSY